jgi:hypothetical protein
MSQLRVRNSDLVAVAGLPQTQWERHAALALAAVILAVAALAVPVAAQVAGKNGPNATHAESARQERPGRQQLPIPAGIEQVVVLDAILGSQPPSTALDCAQISSHSDFSAWENPVGHSVTVQAGFAQGEWTAQTYTVSAASFPLKINTVETIFATSNSTVQTTTRWTVAVWQGPPNTGALVATWSSDGDILPHLVLPPGNAAGIIRFGIDPNHPEQIIVHDDGSGTFSIGFRLDQHNSPSPTPCTTGAATCCNAFPVTDVSGLASPTGNWLMGLNCGPFGCPPNGGWVRFGDLISLCRPSGDWILRANWQPVSCAPGIGACCLPNGTCDITTSTNCQAQSGQYQGDGSTCASPTNCPQPTGACCFSNGNCLNLTETNCTTASGTWLGGGTACNAGACPTGACCMPSGQCLGGITTAQCTSQGGTFQGVGTQCGAGGISCPQPQGACCTSSGGCLLLNQSDCGQIPGAFWAGAFTTCSAQRCCYGNCDGSTTAPILNVEDFTCFINKFAEAQLLTHQQQLTHYANCDASTTAPVLNVEDFTCFINRFASGCP